MFFRKKGKYTDVEGYNRISRLIEDRQREISQNIEEDDDLDDETVLLNREPVSTERVDPRIAEEPAMGSPVRPTPPPLADRPSTGTASVAATVPTPEERRIPFQVSTAVSVPATPPASVLPATPVSAVMTLPELGGPGSNGSFVAVEAVWEGKLVTRGNVRVEGTLHGEVQTTATVFVAANAHLDGVIRAGSMIVAGEVEGQVECSEKLEVLPGGSARGEIQTTTLVVHEGAFIDSRFQMRRADAPAHG